MATFTKLQKAKAEKHFADAYASLAHTEYNLAGTVNSAPLIAFRKGLKTLGLDINRFLPTECPRV